MSNLRSNGISEDKLPGMETPGISRNGGEMRVSQHMIISPSPKDKFTPEKMYDFNRRFIRREKYFDRVQGYVEVHVDHYADEKYNSHLMDILKEKRVHSHLQLANCDLDGHFYHDNDGIMLRRFQLAEFDTYIELNAHVSAMHNAYCIDLVKQLEQGEISEADRLKLAFVTDILHLDLDKMTVTNNITGISFNVHSDDINRIIVELLDNKRDLIHNIEEDLTTNKILAVITEERIHNHKVTISMPRTRPAYREYDDKLADFWIANISQNKDAIIQRIQNDIEMALSKRPVLMGETKETIRKGMVTLQGELRNMGYKVRIQKGMLKLTPAPLKNPKPPKGASPEQLAEYERKKTYNDTLTKVEVSTKRLDQTNYSWELLCKICDDNRNPRITKERINQIEGSINSIIEASNQRLDNAMHTMEIESILPSDTHQGHDGDMANREEAIKKINRDIAILGQQYGTQKLVVRLVELRKKLENGESITDDELRFINVDRRNAFRD